MFLCKWNLFFQSPTEHFELVLPHHCTFSVFSTGNFFWAASSRTKTISPISKFCLVWFHFCLVWNVPSTSFLHRVQTSSDKCWTRRCCFLQYMSSFWEVPGGGMTTLVFELSSCIRLSGIIRLADRICCSFTPPMVLAKGGLRFQLIHSPPNSLKKSLILFSSISPNAFFSSIFAPTKLIPLLLRIILTFSILLINQLRPLRLKRLKAWMKLSAVKLLVGLMYTALMDKYVNIVLYLFRIFRPSLTKNGRTCQPHNRWREIFPKVYWQGYCPSSFDTFYHAAACTLHIWTSLTWKPLCNW